MHTITIFFFNVGTHFFDFLKRAGVFSPHSGDILGNLRVRISDPQKKRGRMGEGRGGGVGGASALALKSSPFTSQKCPLICRIALLFSRITALFSRNAFLLPGAALSFFKSVLLFPRSAFLFLKNASLFSRIVLQFSRIAFFLFPCAIFSFFSSWFNLLLVLLRVTQREFSLLLLFIHLKLQLMTSSW